MIRIAICDDEQHCISDAESAVTQYLSSEDVPFTLKSFSNGDDLIEALRTEKIDILFLDIMMPLLNGMDLAREIRSRDSAVRIIFLTSAPEYAVESYDVKASGYLLKPLDRGRLFRVLADCIRTLKTEPDNIIVRTLLGFQKIYIHNIECIEAQNKRVIFRLSDRTSIEALNTFSYYTEHLSYEKGFFKCHRSYLVSISNIDSFTSTEAITKSGARVPIARAYSKIFKEAYFAYMFNEGSN